MGNLWRKLGYFLLQHLVTLLRKKITLFFTFPDFRIRQRRLHGQAYSDAQKPVLGVAKDGRAEEERNGGSPGSRGGHERKQRVHERRRAARHARHAKADGEFDLEGVLDEGGGCANYLFISTAVYFYFWSTPDCT